MKFFFKVFFMKKEMYNARLHALLPITIVLLKVMLNSNNNKIPESLLKIQSTMYFTDFKKEIFISN